jgi:hypothetical protein
VAPHFSFAGQRNDQQQRRVLRSVPGREYFDFAENGDDAEQKFSRMPQWDPCFSEDDPGCEPGRWHPCDRVKQFRILFSGASVARYLGRYMSYSRALYLLKKFIVSYPSVRVATTARSSFAPLVRHQCTRASCSPFIEVSEDYVCRTSGYIHRCASGGCTRGVVCSTERICALTGNAVTLMDASGESWKGMREYEDVGKSRGSRKRADCDDDEGDYGVYMSCARPRSDVSKEVVDDDDDYDDVADEVDGIDNLIGEGGAAGDRTETGDEKGAADGNAAATAAQRPLKRPRVAHQGRVMTAGLVPKLILEGLRIVREVLQRSSIPMSEDGFPYTTVVDDGIVYLWTEVASTSVYQAKSQRYRFLMHCIVILRFMCKGFLEQGVFIIPPVAEVEQVLRPVSDIVVVQGGRRSVIKHGAFTRANKFFRACMKEILQRPGALACLCERRSTTPAVATAMT